MKKDAVNICSALTNLVISTSLWAALGSLEWLWARTDCERAAFFFFFLFFISFSPPLESLLCLLCAWISPGDLEACMESVQSPALESTQAGGGCVVFLHPRNNVKHLSAPAGRASDSHCQLPLSVTFRFRLDGSHVSLCTPSQFRFSQPVVLHVTCLCLPLFLTVFNVFFLFLPLSSPKKEKPFYLLRLWASK